MIKLGKFFGLCKDLLPIKGVYNYKNFKRFMPCLYTETKNSLFSFYQIKQVRAIEANKLFVFSKKLDLEETRVKGIAEAIAKKPQLAAQYVQEAELKNAKLLEDIALHIERAETLDADTKIKIIGSIGIQNQSFLEEFAWRFSGGNVYPLIRAVELLSLNDQRILENILYKVLGKGEKGVECVLENIEKFKIEEETIRQKVLIFALSRSSPRKVLQHLKQFCIQDLEFLEGFLLKFVQGKRDATILADEIGETGVDNKDILLKIGQVFLEKFPENFSTYFTNLSRQDTREDLIAFFSQKRPDLFLKNIEKLPLPQKTLGKSLEMYANSEYLDPLLKQVFLRVSKYRHTSILKTLAKTVAFQVDRDSSFKEQMLFLAGRVAKKIDTTPLVKDFILPSIYPSIWSNQKEEELRKFLQDKEIKKQFANEVKYSLSQSYLEACIALDKSRSIASLDKVSLLIKAAACAKKEPNKASEVFQTFATILAMRKEQELFVHWKSGTKEELQGILCAHILKEAYADLSDVENLVQKHQMLIDKLRIRFAFSIYEKGLKALGIAAVKRDYTRFFRSLLEGTFAEERYNANKNANLKCLLDNHPTILAKWKENLSIIEEDPSLCIEETDAPLDLFEIPSLVSRTCQHIANSPIYNRCLLSYALDGDIKLLFVKEKETFIARALLRIVFDEKNSPALLMEPVYGDDRGIEPLFALARLKAEALQIPLLAIKTEEGSLHKEYIAYFGGSCSATYSDVLGGILEQEKIHLSVPQLKKISPFSFRRRRAMLV